jgi:CheY-like chemotaxis protein
VVEVATAGQDARIRVQDDGIGIAPDLLPRLFEPFVQGEGGLARTQGGLGLGLALAKRLVVLHGGSISARSAGPGAGAEFLVTLPLAPAAGPAAAGLRGREGPRALEILVIEDNLDAAQSLAAVLELEGHRVHLAADGRTGLEKARQLRPDVILCDIGLPDVDGYEVARAIRADDALRATRLVALTGYALAEDRERALAAGFDDHVAKPPAIGLLLATILARG